MILSYIVDEDSFDYEPDYLDVCDALEELLNKQSKKDLINLMLHEFDIQSELEEYYQDELTDYFEDTAKDAVKDAAEYQKDPLGYYGMSQKDFL